MAEATAQFIEHREKLMAYLLHLVGDSNVAEDLCQEIAVIVLENPTLLTRTGDVFAYLRGVARHLASGRKRSLVRTTEALRHWTEWAWETGPEDEVIEAQRLQQIEHLRGCLKELPGHTKQIVEWRYHAGFDIRRIASQAGQSIEATKSILFRIRRELAKCIRNRMAVERSI